MQFGIDRLVNENFARLQGKRVGLFTNLSAVDRNLTPTYTLFQQSPNIQLVALFAPEHGLAGVVADGVKFNSTIDEQTGIPIHSLYGNTLAPTPTMLEGIDVLVCDIQDIGVRYYTFLWTLTYVLEACSQYNRPVLVLDRPNPLGAQIDGGHLAPDLTSLVGRFSIPIQHGMTIGELAQMVNTLWIPQPAQLEVLSCTGWDRTMQWTATQRPFVAPSPNMPHFITALHYPGACLVEGTILSEGRGTALPFEVVGAPFIDGFSLAKALNAQGLGGAKARPHQFEPTASKFKGQLCGGVQIHITDHAIYQPLHAWLIVLQTIATMYLAEFDWLPPHGDLQHFDRLIGNLGTRELIESGETLNNLFNEWSAFHAEFRSQRKPFLVYSEA